ncbi:EAL domain-containing protein [Alicyclobacillus acidocaldarius]|uniref:Diguanylate phosphodiesterase n=1 Tax=Alicyclobacillus acidocaldarius (strain Tc-4-1) TaxID=1048834 RepID=F8IL83_ALIAT|nr:EAL domain-containing protein [Alicyclobacillus acidocaldarius]AEJ43649.1 diguanylate phosphodiesterase [Alicyclobacillus acidocaldarius subsp. acidocaldarius Tc-4-1]
MTMRLQPIVRIPQRTCVGHELLIAHPRDTLNLVAQAGLLGELDRYIVHTARKLAQERQDYVFVNVTSELLNARSLPFDHRDSLRGLVLEITERGRLDVEAAAAYLEPFRKRGLEVALDDLGTGYNGFSRWSVLRPEWIKATWSEELLDFFPMLIAMARRLGARFIVERVEMPEQESWLVELGVEYGQGFLYGRPIPLGAVS